MTDFLDLLIADATKRAAEVQAHKKNTEPTKECKEVYEKVFEDIRAQEESVDRFKKHFGL